MGLLKEIKIRYVLLGVLVYVLISYASKKFGFNANVGAFILVAIVLGLNCLRKSNT